MAKILNKARSDIDDKFCKFEIKKLVEGDETISIISDTWSTDVLASDSETLEPVENERNFSTPLIPSNVVLPGDNNFNPLTNAVSQLRVNFLDASDTRSESAWSTDVLASDSEKMTEVDTDDNQSIAAKSDTTDANRSEVDPIPDLIPTANQRAPDSPFFSPRNPSVNFRAPDSPLFSSNRNSSNSQFDYRRLNGERQSPRFPNEDYSRFASPIPSNGRNNVNKRYTDTAFRSYRTNSENGNNFERDPFLNATGTNMRRQNSTESSISNQSSTLDDAVALNKSKHATENKSNFSINDYLRENVPTVDHGAEVNVVKTSTDIINPFADDDLNARVNNGTADLRRQNIANKPNQSSEFVEEQVEHRRISNEQRIASFDGRRNGISFSTSSAGSNSITQASVKRFANSLNYENHEIIAKAKTSSLQLLSSSATDDDKNKQQDEFILIQKTMSLSLKGSNDTSNQSPTEINNESFAVEPSTSDGVNKTTTKYTGAIPKSISFDSSADKNMSDRKYDGQNHLSLYNQPPNGRQNGFFSKIKQGFKRRGNNKLPRTTFDDFAAPLDGVSNNNNNTSVATSSLFYSGNTQKPVENGFNDTTEDILEKYRRKISSSSEANSDSLGNNSSNDRKSLTNLDEQHLSGMLHDESIYLYTKTKQKLRLVLSTTDLHTADFRHTNVNITCNCIISFAK